VTVTASNPPGTPGGSPQPGPPSGKNNASVVTPFADSAEAIALTEGGMMAMSVDATTARISSDVGRIANGTAISTGSQASARVGTGTDTEEDRNDFPIAEGESKGERGRDTLLAIRQQGSIAQAAFIAEARDHRVLSMEMVPDDEDSEKVRPFDKTLGAADEAADTLSLLILQAEGKALRVSSSVAQADDGVATVLAVAGKPRVAPVEQVVARKSAPAVDHGANVPEKADATAHEESRMHLATEATSGRSWLRIAAGAAVAVVALAWRWKSAGKRRAEKLKEATPLT
jgi:hypothetical protein